MMKPIKVALARIPADMDTDPEVIALVRTAADRLASAGYDVTETDVPDLAGTWRLWCDLIMTELSVLQEAQMREHGSADFRQALNGFLKMATILDGRAYMEAIARPESRRCSRYIGAARADVAAAVSSAPSSPPAISATHPQRVGTTAPPA